MEGLEFVQSRKKWIYRSQPKTKAVVITAQIHFTPALILATIAVMMTMFVRSNDLAVRQPRRANSCRLGKSKVPTYLELLNNNNDRP